jgi:hypothetical protein
MFPYALKDGQKIHQEGIEKGNPLRKGEVVADLTTSSRGFEINTISSG